MSSLPHAAARLVAHFRRQRPLRGGSLIVTLFGDSIMPRGGAITLGSLIRLGAPFGLNERLVRTAAARLAEQGWLETRRHGRLSEYRLSASGRVRFLEATRRIYAEPAPWSGRWTLIVLADEPAAPRRRRRMELTWRGYGELAAGVFARPAAQAGEVAPSVPGALIFDAELEEPFLSQALVSRGWDLEELAAGYRRFVRRFEGVSEAVRGARRIRRADPEACFIVRTLLIHEYRRLHLRDPALPARLLPKDWPGHDAARRCREIYSSVLAASESHLSAVAARLDGALPPPDRSVHARFGLGRGAVR